MKVINLDLDNMNFKSLLKRIDKIKQYSWSRIIDVAASPHLGGYHIRISTFWHIKPSASYHIRYELGDDPKRLVRDMLGIGGDLLFDIKYEEKFSENFMWESIKMFKYLRTAPDTKWQNMKIQSLVKNGQLLSSQSQDSLPFWSVNQVYSNSMEGANIGN